MRTIPSASRTFVASDAGPWLPRLLVAGICLPFLYSALSKTLDFGAAVDEFSALALPFPAAIVALTIVVQAAGTVLLTVGRGGWAVTGAALLAAFAVMATLIAHAFWTVDGPARAGQANIFIEHVSIICGLVLAGWWKQQQE